ESRKNHGIFPQPVNACPSLKVIYSNDENALVVLEEPLNLRLSPTMLLEVLRPATADLRMTAQKNCSRGAWFLPRNSRRCKRSPQFLAAGAHAIEVLCALSDPQLVGLLARHEVEVESLLDRAAGNFKKQGHARRVSRPGVIVIGRIKAPAVAIAKGNQRGGDGAAMLQGKDLASAFFRAAGFNHEFGSHRIVEDFSRRGLPAAQVIDMRGHSRVAGVLADRQSHALELAQATESTRMAVGEAVASPSRAMEPGSAAEMLCWQPVPNRRVRMTNRSNVQGKTQL